MADPVVLLDEGGLAEESPHLPLKVLHKELEKPGEGITCIGISNWALDAANADEVARIAAAGAAAVANVTMEASVVHAAGALRAPAPTKDVFDLCKYLFEFWVPMF